jgi:glycosyltransferase involved in cell wall biosynthesis
VDTTLPTVSVVIPYAGSTAHLDVVLTAILETDYPAGLLQIVVVECPAAGRRPEAWSRVAAQMDSRWVRHGRRGFAPASARNAGVAAAGGEIIVGLDGDMVISPGHFLAHAHHHQLGGAVMSLGLRRFIAPPNAAPGQGVFGRLSARSDLPMSTSNRLGHRLDWRGRHVADLCCHAAPYELALGCNAAYPRAAAIEVGGWSSAFDGSFGNEDIEFASRLLRAGCDVLWAPGAQALHLEDDGPPDWKADRRRNFDLACRLIPGFREYRLREGEFGWPTSGAPPDYVPLAASEPNG